MGQLDLRPGCIVLIAGFDDIPEQRRLHNGLGFWLFGSLIIRLVAQSFQRTQSV
jgi:hypothetical protein